MFDNDYYRDLVGDSWRRSQNDFRNLGIDRLTTQARVRRPEGPASGVRVRAREAASRGWVGQCEVDASHTRQYAMHFLDAKAVSWSITCRCPRKHCSAH